MDAFTAALLWVSVAIFLLTVVALVVRSRNSIWLRDERLRVNAQPRLNMVLASVLTLTACGEAILGITFLTAGRSIGWTFFPLAIAQLLIVGFYTWIVRKPSDESSPIP
jgi:cytochrome c biogenesis protein ResB